MESNFEKLSGLIERQGNVSVIIEILYDVLKTQQLLAIQHPLGFYSIKLAELANNKTLRLHIWKNQEKLQSEDLMIHNHIFNFESLVLLGEISNHTYKIIDSTEENGGHFYEVSYNQSGSLLNRTSTKSILIPNSIEVTSCGNFYSGKYDVFHQSKSTSASLSATLLLTTLVSENKPLVYCEIDKGEEVFYQRKPLVGFENEKLLNELIHDLRSLYKI